jgi:hypothetical protein
MSVIVLQTLLNVRDYRAVIEGEAARKSIGNQLHIISFKVKALPSILSAIA